VEVAGLIADELNANLLPSEANLRITGCNGRSTPQACSVLVVLAVVLILVLVVLVLVLVEFSSRRFVIYF
jgi:hypothetical protein